MNKSTRARALGERRAYGRQPGRSAARGARARPRARCPSRQARPPPLAVAVWWNPRRTTSWQLHGFFPNKRRDEKRRDRSSAQLPGADGGHCSSLDRLAQGARESRQRARGHGIGRCMLQRARATTGELERWFRRDRAGPAHAPRASGSQDDTSLSPKSGRARPDSDCCACAAERRVVCTGRAPRFGGLPPSPCRR